MSLTVEDARHLLGRTGFGAAPSEIESLLPLSRPQAVDRILSDLRTAPTLPMPAWVTLPKHAYADQQNMTRDEREAFRIERVREMTELKAWWLAEMIATPSPMTERLTLFWHNHFTSSYQGTGRWTQMLAEQNALFREAGAGSFADLLHRILRDPAMLRYLDASFNRKNRPNENLARELLELFTLGEGHYTERDIKETARALSGRGVDAASGYAMIDRPMMHDTGRKTILGRTGQFGPDDVADVLLSQDRTAVFIVRKLWREFVSEEPDEAVIARLAADLRADGYQLKPLLYAMLNSDAFWAPANRGTLIRSPADLVAGSVRSLALPIVETEPLAAMTKRLGQDLFEPPNVKGWPGGTNWINPAWLLYRYQAIEKLMGLRDTERMAMGSRPVAFTAEEWMAALPAECRGPECWRALTPLPPVQGVDPGETPDRTLRRIAGDLTYQLR